MAAIKLWYSSGACSLAPHILLNEAGIEFESVKLDVHAGYPKEFRHINPKMKVPVLLIDGQTITENPAIMTAISQLVPDKHLLGKTNLEIVRAYEWMNWISGVVHGQAFGGLFRPHRYSDDPTTYPSIKARALLTVQECFATIDQDLSSEHAVGSDFTAVDAYLYVFHRWGTSLGIDMNGKYPKYTGLVVNLAKRESVQAALKAEGIESHVPLA
jgi:glutathione S-transferase